ncbi:hypothetical protein [Archaeoglobus fulgidus]|jgi:hypothetical protein|uniref:Uncharacterized protein n=2 Tax=Archaeoglobus fulgidus TaxID=2234 RepID=A0A075WCE3_ARCFL|nr:hypothetical protein [Archaeoglobus fulgidus]AIG97227.1 hypothetical protein AFULGI_00004130 [Archaeoglobus fulgidus DSM 8774]KUJ94383.1 MAG: hypothetical protein XD40_0477 [Archaeoglobus fulgidus]KUK06540.1 MAG: Uncharacterized protein XD48_1220 [Archaeoglobus fulgidus]
MWLRVTTFPDKEMAMELTSKLRNSGARVEVREIVEWDFEERYFLRGNLSELEEYEEAQDWKNYSEIIREILKGRMEVSEFEREFLKRASPENYEKVVKLKDESLGDEEFLDAMEAAFRVSLLMSSVYSFLKANGIEVGEDYIEGELPEDPTIIIELDEEVEGCEKGYFLQLTPAWDVNVDILSVLTKDVELEGLDGVVIDAAARIVMNVIAGLEETNDIEKLKEYTSGIIEDADNLDGELYVDAEEVYEAILKSLEKAGIVRVSGRKVKLRK